MSAPLFFSTFMYSACKVVGADNWPDVLKYELGHLDDSGWHGFRTLGQVKRAAPDCVAYVDASTYIDRARCVAAGTFLRYRKCDVWLTCDDDVYADEGVVSRLIENCRVSRGLVALPYMNRDGGSMTFRKVTGPTVWQPHAARVVDRVGMGLVAMHRDFVQALASFAVHFRSKESGPIDSPYIFCNGVDDDGTFIGEDFGVCQLAERAGLPMHVLLDAPGQHMNLCAMLDLEGGMLVQGDAHADKLARGVAEKNAAHAAQTLAPEPITSPARRRVDG
jgi:hypothetical protein